MSNRIMILSSLLIFLCLTAKAEVPAQQQPVLSINEFAGVLNSYSKPTSCEFAGQFDQAIGWHSSSIELQVKERVSGKGHSILIVGPDGFKKIDESIFVYAQKYSESGAIYREELSVDLNQPQAQIRTLIFEKWRKLEAAEILNPNLNAKRKIVGTKEYVLVEAVECR